MIKFNYIYNFHGGYIVNYSLIENGAEYIRESYQQSLNEAKEFVKRIKKYGGK